MMGLPPSALVIEDDPDINTLLCLLLTQAGFQVQAAADGDTGIALAQELTPDVVTVDLNMPGIGGVETIHRIRSITAGHILLISASDDAPAIRAALAAGAGTFIAKPFRAREILSVVRDLAGLGS
ncbi:response regulator [Pseudarthrobacter sp. PS3-L1]|uniref:response regulator n=1 Tax=Pseudarthrobacter sp. PS3-L1 TaxID=3046207 RepID=UPI0024BB1819|nr:response regulator [Pseudarthrobacter sp. PS3-L1]MDJ0319673.1 response regulator [Pseudarthrobacter sp. PS3-L1]